MIYIKYDNQREKEFALKMVEQMNLNKKELIINDEINFIGLMNVPNSITGENNYTAKKLKLKPNKIKC